MRLYIWADLANGGYGSDGTALVAARSLEEARAILRAWQAAGDGGAILGQYSDTPALRRFAMGRDGGSGYDWATPAAEKDPALVLALAEGEAARVVAVLVGEDS